MTHIRDGLIAVTQDREVYMLKFNYSNIDNLQFKNDLITKGDGDFLHLIWKDSLKNVVPLLDKQHEIPQIFYSDSFNLAFIAFTHELLIFNVTEVEQKKPDAQVHSPS